MPIEFIGKMKLLLFNFIATKFKKLLGRKSILKRTKNGGIFYSLNIFINILMSWGISYHITTIFLSAIRILSKSNNAFFFGAIIISITKTFYLIFDTTGYYICFNAFQLIVSF